MPDQIQANGLTIEEQEQFLRLAAKLNPGRLGTPVFNAVARLLPINGIEAVCIRMWNGEEQVYLTQRGADEAYAGQQHVPGSILRMKETYNDVFERLQEREFGCQLVVKTSAGFPLNNLSEARGHGVHFVFLCEIEGQETVEQQGNGKWFPVDKLPKSIIEWHKTHVIPEALKAFRNK